MVFISSLISGKSVREDLIFVKRYLDNLDSFREATAFALRAKAVWAQSTLLGRIQIVGLSLRLEKLLARIDGHLHVTSPVRQIDGYSISSQLSGALLLFAFALRFGFIFEFLLAFEAVEKVLNFDAASSLVVEWSRDFVLGTRI